MKNLLNLFVVLAFVSFAFSSCGTKKCANATTEISVALTAYSDDASTANCQAYKAALEKGKDKCDAGNYDALIAALNDCQ